MRAEKWGTSLSAFCFACLLSCGAVGCLITAFAIESAHFPEIALCWALSALVAILALRWKYGTFALTGLLAFLTGYIYRRGIAEKQLLSLIYRISRIYDSAYGWGTLQLRDGIPPQMGADWVLGILGCLIALCTCFVVCRRKRSWPALLLAGLTVAPCVVVTDTVPHEIALFFLLAGGIVLLLTDTVRQENEEQGLRLTAIALLPVLLSLIGVFLLFPQNNYVNHSEQIRQDLLHNLQTFPRLVETGLQRAATHLQGGESRQVDLTTVGPREVLTYPVMDVTSEAGGILYLRGQDLDIYSGKGWSASPEGQEDFFLPGEQADRITIRTRSSRSLFYIPYYPAEPVPLHSGKADNPEKEKEYSFSVSALPADWRVLTAGGESSDAGANARYLSLPESTRRGAEPLLEGLLTGTNTEKAHRIGALVCASARYDTTTPPMPAGEADFALWFLREAETGYCVHFATAAVVLLRAADVPARYVTGYMVDARPGRTVTVTEEEAHAWAEYYEPVLDAWLVLEATPADLREEESLPTVSAETEGEPTGQTLPETLPPAQTQLPDMPDLPEPDRGTLTAVARVLVVLTAALLIAEIQRSTRLRLRRRKQRSGQANEQALARWREAEILCRLLKESPDQTLLELAQKAKFSPHALTEEELMQFDAHNRSCLRRLRNQNPLRRLIHQYIYAIY